MDGIDVSNYQSGINLDVVPCKLVIILVTENGAIVNPDWRRQCDQALNAGKLVGLYNYVGGYNATAEADAFWNVTCGYSGRVVYAVDWEPGSNSAWGNLGYLDALVRRLKARSNRTILLYAPAGSYPRGVAAANGCPTWVAQYADFAPTGYQAHPWNDGAYQADVRQYSGSGRLPGWNGDLDLDLYYGSEQQWLEWAGNGDVMALTDDDIMRIWTHKLPNGSCVRDCLSPAISDILAAYDTGLNRGQWMHVLPNKRVARDIISDATSDVITINDKTLPAMQKQLTDLTSLAQAQATQITALTTAVDSLAKALGQSPEDIEKVIADAVKTKLASLKITVE